MSKQNTYRAAQKQEQILGAPHPFSLAILRMRSRISLLMRGRPGFLFFDFHFQYRRKPLRCHFVTVSGLTRINAFFHFGQALWRPTQKAWSPSWILGLGRLSLKIASCCLKARFSIRRSWFDLDNDCISQIMILMSNRNIYG